MIGFDTRLKQEVFNKIDLTINDVTYFFDGQDTHVKAKCWKWVGLTNILVFDGIPYDIVKSTNSLFDFMVLGVDLSLTVDLTVKNFTWFTGTYRETNTDFTNMGNDERDKLPMIWLSFTPVPSSKSADALSPIGYTHSFSMYFCASAYFRDFTTENHMRTRVDNLEIYVQEFIKTINQSYFYGSDDGVSHTIYRFPKFGNFNSDSSKSIIDSQLSAIELSLELQEKKECYC